MKSFSKFFLSLFLIFISSFSFGQSKKPNIIYIMADDLGIGDLGVYGQEKIKTPNLDQFAKEGMVFTDFYAGSTVCAPSRATIMAGQHTGHTLLRGNSNVPIDPNQKILPEYLKDAGYTTAMFGKWGLGLANTVGSPEKRGWDEFAGFLLQRDAHYQFPDSIDMIRDGVMTKQPFPNDLFANDYFLERSDEFIRSQSGEKPFFLYLSYTIPHAELVLSEESLKQYLDQDGESIFPDEKAWPDGQHYGPQEFPKAAYAAMVSHLDHQIGQLMTTLKEKGLEENTLVIFTSDNGTHTEGGRTDADIDFFKSSARFRGKKRDLYEGGVHVPFLARWVGTVKPGSVSHFKGAFYDLLPTLAQLAGEKLEGEIDGISFVPALTGKGNQEEHPYLYWEFHEQGGKQAILVDNWKVIRLEVDENPQGVVELYDLSKDPSESHDVAYQFPEKAAELTSILDGVRTENPHFNFGRKN